MLAPKTTIDNFAAADAHIAELKQLLLAIENRATRIASDAFGPLPERNPYGALGTIERGIFDLRQRIARLEEALGSIVALERENPTMTTITMVRVARQALDKENSDG